MYLLEAWGASGSTGIGNQGGYGAAAASWRTGGGYSSGILTLQRPAELYLFIGSSPTNGDGYGGYNGGGNDQRGPTIDNSYGGGGGATDFRIVDSNNCLEENSLKSRILVAGGSGGSHEQPWGRGGYGGGESAYGSLAEGNNKGYSEFYATGGTQESGGTGGKHTSTGGYCTPGSFGIGGDGYDGGGGGGGWYGGGGGAWGIGGGGGSSFAFHSKDQKLPDNYGVNERFLLNNPVLLNGNQTMPSYTSGYVTGNYGHGAARILILSSYFYQTCRKRNYVITPAIVNMIFVIVS